MLNTYFRRFVEHQIRSFPENRRTLARYESNRLSYEDALLSPSYLLQTTLSVNAIGSALDRLAPEDRELIRLMYWSENYSADGIAHKLNITKSTVYSRLNTILREIARRIGYINFDE